jgi:hypothetical protein
MMVAKVLAEGKRLRLAMASQEGVIVRWVQLNNIVNKSLRTSLTVKGMGFYPKGGPHALEGDVCNGTKRRIYPVMEDWKKYNYQYGRDVQYQQDDCT